MGSLSISRAASSMTSAMSGAVDMAVETLSAEDAVADRISSSPSEDEPTSSVGGTNAAATSEEVQAIMRDFKARARPITTAGYEEVLDTLGKRRAFSEALEVLQDMRSNSRATAVAYASVMHAVRRSLKPLETRAIFCDSPDPSSLPTTALAERASLHFDQAKQVVEWMQQDRLELPEPFFDSLAEGLSSNGHGGILLGIAMSLEKRGIQPSNYFYNRVLDCLMRCGMTDRAQMLFTRMVMKGAASLETYVTRMNSLVEAGRGRDARALWDDMAGKFALNAMAYNVLLKMHLREGNLNAALSVLDDMCKSGKTAPNIISARIFMTYLLDIPDIQGTKHLFDDLFPRVNYPETTADYGNMLRFWSRIDTAKVLRLMEQMRARGIPADDLDICHAFMSMLADRRVPGEWKPVLIDECLLQGGRHEPPADGLAAMCPNLPPGFRSLLAFIETRHCPTTLTLELIFRRYMSVGGFSEIASVYEQLLDRVTKGNAPLGKFRVYLTPAHRNYYVTALLRLNRLDHAAREIRYMSSKRYSIMPRNIQMARTLGVELPPNFMTRNASHVTAPPTAAPPADGASNGGSSGAVAREERKPFQRRFDKPREVSNTSNSSFGSHPKRYNEQIAAAVEETWTS